MLRAVLVGLKRPVPATGGAAAALLDAMTHRSCSLILLTDGNTSSRTVFQVTLSFSSHCLDALLQVYCFPGVETNGLSLILPSVT